MDTREQLVEKIAKWFFYKKFPPSNDPLAYNLRWEDIPFDGCESTREFCDKAQELLSLIEQPEVKGWKEAVKAERAKVFNELEDYIKQYGRMAVFPCEDERSKEWQSLKGAK